MSPQFSNRNQKKNLDTAENAWRGLYLIAGMGAFLAVGFTILDISLSFGGGDAVVGKLSVVEWFAQFQNNWLLGLRNLGLFNMITPILTLPLYLALYHIHRKSAPAYSALALILFIMGAVIYDANNKSLSMMVLSQKYAAATSEAQMSLLTTAGAVFLAQAEDFTPGSFVGIFLSNVASIVMMAVILQGRVFSKWIALTGLVGLCALLFYTISATFLPAIYDLAMVGAMVGGLLMVAWDILMAIGMLRRSGAIAQPEAKQGSLAQPQDQAA